MHSVSACPPVRRSAFHVLSALSSLPPPSAQSVPDSLPLTAPRTIEFEAREGTRLSLDVSPDGQTIVLDLMGDIHTFPVGGGQAKPITQGPAFDSQPRWSPDGRRIVFLSNRDVRNALKRYSEFYRGNTIGRLYDGDTLDDVYPRKNPLGPQWWWNRDAGDVGPAVPTRDFLPAW
jgi:dipeptidyl aminopeptidase/acylaminoacyl peptidase